MQKSYLILLAHSYPYTGASEQTFLTPEIQYLARAYEVIAVPGRREGTKLEVPAGVTVDESYAEMMRVQPTVMQSIFKAMRSSLLYGELLRRPSVLFQLLSLKRLVAYADKAERTKQWACDFVKREGLDARACIFYTFWFDATTTGIGLARDCAGPLVVVSRAHGNDLYEERHVYNYIPCRAQSIQLLDGVFPDSDAGRDYLLHKYAKCAATCETARLGVEDPGFVASKSRDGVVRIVSCSFMVPVKRVDLILQGIGVAAKRRPDLQFQWHHFGTGPLRETLEEQAETLPTNCTWHLPGYLSVDHLMQHYRDSPVDLFINASSTEGTPVAVMEAISCGIPVAATAVGGNPEIVSTRNGLLLSANPTPDEIASAILSIADDPAVAEKRQGSRSTWQEKYDSKRNFQTFIATLTNLRAQKRVAS
jgi:glycosyltransferase involved in cell wall biosynthesis